jgi:hypothetical protein
VRRMYLTAAVGAIIGWTLGRKSRNVARTATTYALKPLASGSQTSPSSTQPGNNGIEIWRLVFFAGVAITLAITAYLLIPPTGGPPPPTPTSKISVMVDRPDVTGLVVLNVAGAQLNQPVSRNSRLLVRNPSWAAAALGGANDT